MRARWILVVPALLLALACAPSASAKEKLLTLYSPRLESLPYVHRTYQVPLAADGAQAPREPGYVLGFKEQAIVDSKDPDAKPLPIGKMMVHHLIYFAPGRVDQGSGSCWQGAGFLSGRGEEHPDGQFGKYWPPALRNYVGIPNRLPDGRAPGWSLTAMVMNHYKRTKSFYVRTKVWYTTEHRATLYPLVLGRCSTLLNGMAYDVPGGGGKGSNFVDSSRWRVPPDMTGRIIGGASHQHGGAKYQTLSSVTCRRPIFKAPAYYGTPNHIYNTIRPILHEPGPIANGTFGTATGVPVHAGEVLERRAAHDNANLHVASMGFWVLEMVKDSTVRMCAPAPRDMFEVGKPARYDRTPDYGRLVPQLARPAGPERAFSGSPLTVGDQFFAPGRVTVRRGQTVTWRFAGREPHSVTVANGPRGFSSLYTGNASGTYRFTPTVPGVYRLTCLIHPTTMAETLVVKD
jgi:hypothetical protein